MMTKASDLRQIRGFLQLFRDAELGGSGAGIAAELLLGGQDRLSRDDPDLGGVAADTDGEILRAGTALRLVLHELLDHPVLERMEGDDA